MLIAQISDFHLLPRGVLAYEAADTASALGKVVDHINGLVPAPDVVIVSGDIADGGRLDSYHLARELLTPLEMPIPLSALGHHLWKAAGQSSKKGDSISNMVRWVESMTGTKIVPGSNQ